MATPTEPLAGGNTRAFPTNPSDILGGNIRRPDKAQPLYLQGDELIYDSRNNRVTARGNVEIYYNDYILTADEVIYDRRARTLTARGNAVLRDPNNNVTRGSTLMLTDDFTDAFAQSLSVTTRDNTRIAARRAVRRDGNVTEFTDGKFTPCQNDPSKPPLWCLSASRIIHNQQAATITYQDAQFEILGVPVLYLPYFQHADPSVKRRSGFLLPSIQNSDTLGFTTEVPYYFALAPNYDFLFHPRYMSKQGMLWQGEWRHRLRRGEYNLRVAAIHQNDEDEVLRGPLDNEWRGSVQTRGRFSLSSWWRFGWDITAESDDSFRRFYKLDNILQSDRVNTVYLTGLSDRNFFSITGYHFGGLLFNDTAQSESRVHPVIDWNYVVGNPVIGGELRINSNFTSLSRSDGADSNRASIEAKWRRKIIDPVGQVWTPFVHLRGDAFSFTNNVNPANPALVAGEDAGTRGMITGGINYAYPFVASTNWASHIIEPIGQIIVRPVRVRQRTIPDEDAKSLVFDDTLLFDTDKFSGYDRLESGTRANVGLQYTFQAYRGGYARAIIGQSFHLGGENPYERPGFDATGQTVFSQTSGLESDRSDYVAGLYVAPSDSFRLLAQARFDEDDFSLRRQDLFAYIKAGPLVAQAAYTYVAADPTIGLQSDQQDVSAAIGLKLTDRWSLLTSAIYDIDQGDLLKTKFEVRYHDDCFVLTASYEDTRIEDPDLNLEADRSVMLRFELKHLGSFRYKTDQLDTLFAENQPPQQ
ncbi:MAG: LPS-assembly protein LptD [Pseudomonadota bacterium]